MSAFGGFPGASPGGALGAKAKLQHNPNGDAEVAQPPTDSVSSLCFSPTSNLLVATSWDSQVRCWEISPQHVNGAVVAAAAPKAAVSHSDPVLCSAWNNDGTVVFSAGCDKQAKMWNLATNQQQQVAAHEAPVKEIAYIADMKLLVTGSWDKTLKYWDLRQANPVHTEQLPERCYAMSVVYPLLVVGTASCSIRVYHLSKPQEPFSELESPLKKQTRCITCFPDQKGFLVGCIEGRVAVQHVEDANKNFTFKCHRQKSAGEQFDEIYSVNALSFHPKHHTFATAGSDGACNFWDKQWKSRLKQWERANESIPCATFNNDGSLFAYAVSYDWSRGYACHNMQTAKHHILLHTVGESEMVPRPPAARGGAGRR